MIKILVAILLTTAASGEEVGYVLSPHNSLQISTESIKEILLAGPLEKNSVVENAATGGDGLRLGVYDLQTGKSSQLVVPSPLKSQDRVVVDSIGRVFQFYGDSSPLFDLGSEVEQADCVTLTPWKNLIAVACRMTGGMKDLLRGYDVSSKKVVWEIPMTSDLFGDNLELTWAMDKYVVAELKGRTGCAVAIFDIFSKKEIFSQDFDNANFHFQILPGKILLRSPSGLQSKSFD